ncbi:inverse autotransporter beta domain-containing protein [Thorsellia kenyensis]|uniref:Inverse autotransporter beta domain-containing protein n=1 Tax=Thorsellia kenyensis TaxID=1549888 RepID=A0ABV6CCS9_9GAMM
MKKNKTRLFLTFLIYSICQHTHAVDEQTNPLQSNFSIHTIESEITVEEFIRQKEISLIQLNQWNDKQYTGQDILKFGQILKLENKTQNQSTLPELSSIEDNSVVGSLLSSTPVGNYMTESYETNIANAVKYVAEEDWSKFKGKELIKKSEDYLLNQATSNVNSTLNNEVSGLLGKFGKAEVNISVDKDGKLQSSSLRVLSPLYDQKEDLIFSQVGVHEQGTGNDRRLIGNFGLGYRYETNNYLLGANTFIDHDFTGSNTRLGVGGEFWMDNLKIASNIYTPLSGWKESVVMKEYEALIYDERAAKGFDIRAQGYLPSYPHLGSSLVFEQYFGDEVALFSTDERQKDPYALTLGFDYTPIPLLTADVSHKVGKNSKEDTRFGLNLNLQLGTPIEKQLDPSMVAQARSLKGSRYDIVDRNYDIVFEYKKEDFFVKVEGPSEGQINQLVRFKASYQSRSDIEGFKWSIINPNGIKQSSRRDNSNSSGIFEFTPFIPGHYQIFVEATTQRGHVGTSNVIDFYVELNENNQSSMVWVNGSNQAEVNPDISLSEVSIIALPSDKRLSMDFFAKNEEGYSIDIDDPELLWRIKGESVQWREFNAESLTQGIRSVPQKMTDNQGNSYWRFHVIANESFENIEVQFLAKSKSNLELISRNLLEGNFIPEEEILFKPENIVIELYELNTPSYALDDGAKLITQSGYDRNRMISYQQPQYIFVNSAYEVVVKHKNPLTNELEVITPQVEHSIRWSYINPYSGEEFYQNDDLNFLKSCNGRPIITTQITNYEGNEFAYGTAIRTNIDEKVINEQQLQLSATINYKRLQDPSLVKQGDERICQGEIDGLFFAENGYIGFQGESREDRVASIDNLRAGEWK